MFERLKELFIIELILAQFDYDKETVVECDSSGYTTRGVFLQYDGQGFLKSCVYFSKKNSPAECNYKIHDKELLAVICCFENWNAELRLIKKFIIITDHKNLEYFMSLRKLNERQIRWSIFMS